MPQPGGTHSSIRRVALLAILVSLAFLALLSVRQLRYELRAYAVLEQFLDPSAMGPLIRLETHSVTVESVTIPSTVGPISARLYSPVGVVRPPGIVVVHGIHHLGMDEPRLVNFAHAIAGSGFAVLTPEIAALADYHVDSASIATIGESAEWLEQRLGKGPVALEGISFAGGLSLLAAANPQYAPHIRLVGVLGGYDDLSRVSRFLITNQAEFPDGHLEPYRAHEYGALVFVYAHLDHFFSRDDMATAHEALRLWLWERPQQAQTFLPKLSPAGTARMQLLFSHNVDELRAQILEEIQSDQPKLSAISPHGKLENLHIPVYILHGSTDDIIPSTEGLWLEQEVPRADLRAALITPAFSHVDPAKDADWREQLLLVHFVAKFLQGAN